MSSFKVPQLLILFLAFALYGNVANGQIKVYKQTGFQETVNDFSYNSASSKTELARADAAKILFEFIYPDKDCYSLTTYYPKNAEETSGIYKYIVPLNPDKRIMNMEYMGIHGEYHIFEMTSETYFYDGSGNRTYSHSNYISAYAVNMINKEVIQQRWDDENGVPIYNEKYTQIWV